MRGNLAQTVASILRREIPAAYGRRDPAKRRRTSNRNPRGVTVGSTRVPGIIPHMDAGKFALRRQLAVART
jgi:hypothetical protein